MLAGAFLALVMELCGVRALSFAIGVYLPLSTTLPIYIGGVIRGVADKVKKKRGVVTKDGEEELERGNLFATGLVAGGALMGVIFAFLNVSQHVSNWLKKFSLEEKLTEKMGEMPFYLLGVAFFAIMGYMLYRAAVKKQETL